MHIMAPQDNGPFHTLISALINFILYGKCNFFLCYFQGFEVGDNENHTNQALIFHREGKQVEVNACISFPALFLDS